MTIIHCYVHVHTPGGSGYDKRDVLRQGLEFLFFLCVLCLCPPILLILHPLWFLFHSVIYQGCGRPLQSEVLLVVPDVRPSEDRLPLRTGPEGDPPGRLLTHVDPSSRFFHPNPPHGPASPGTVQRPLQERTMFHTIGVGVGSGMGPVLMLTHVSRT